MIQKNNSNHLEEYTVEKNQPEEFFKIILPDKWWCIHNTYNLATEKNFKIIRLSSGQQKQKQDLLFPGWDIKRGDYISNSHLIVNKLTRKQRTLRGLIILTGFIVFVIYLVIRISTVIANSGN